MLYGEESVTCPATLELERGASCRLGWGSVWQPAQRWHTWPKPLLIHAVFGPDVLGG